MRRAEASAAATTPARVAQRSREAATHQASRSCPEAASTLARLPRHLPACLPASGRWHDIWRHCAVSWHAPLLCTTPVPLPPRCMPAYTSHQSPRPLWPASIPPSSTTDHIPLPVDAPLAHDPPRLARHASHPAYPTLLPPPSPPPPLPNPTLDGTMAARATITFSQPGVQPPVYVTTSLNNWTLVQMQPLHDKTASGDLIFSREFTGVAEGSHQYKIRVGEDHWVLDESKETGMSFYVLVDCPADSPQLPSTRAFATTLSTSSLPARAPPCAQRPKLPPTQPP